MSQRKKKRAKNSNKGQQLSLFTPVIEDEYNSILSKINQRQKQILVHSCLYYRYDTNLIDDFTYDKFARELSKLQLDNPDIADKSLYAKAFKDFGKDHCYSGYNLPTHRPEILAIAQRLLWLHERYSI